MNCTRRDLGRLALAALPAARMWAAKPNSVWGGVQVGINAPYSFHNIPGTADDILNYMTQLNLSAAELRLQPVEAYLKAPAPWTAPPAGRGQPHAGRLIRFHSISALPAGTSEHPGTALISPPTR